MVGVCKSIESSSTVKKKKKKKQQMEIPKKSYWELLYCRYFSSYNTDFL